MLAGLLRQPRLRGKVEDLDPRMDSRTTQRRIAELEEKLARTEDLVRVLKDLPWSRPPSSTEEKADGRRRKRGTSKKRGRPGSRGRSTTDRRSDVAGRAETG